MCREWDLPSNATDYAATGVCQVNLNPSSVLVCLLPKMGEKGHNAGTDTPGPSSTAECPEITTMLNEIMGKKGTVRNWLQAFDIEKANADRPGSSAKSTQAQLTTPIVLSVSPDEAMVAEEQPLIRKRRDKTVGASGVVSKKRKETVDETERPLPNGVWDPSFTLSHKIEFNLDNSEKRVVESMTEQQMADAMLEMASRTAMAAWHMAYASD
ncbi:hypothetical protein LR48_Vigan10g261600 [Vigna angularis]|uniref:Uncharacterized protein n=1 Tax=Phaseolus angularis TaxID=3914 RepID=A0A0L9VPP8_PHAAN|nr:hypothetical protein LR48_Vigan10g261600 [Vigna angularis]